MLTPIILATASVLAGAQADPPPTDYRDLGQLEATMGDLADRFPQRTRVRTYGESREGRPLRVVTLGTADSESRPAMLVVAGLDPLHRAGPEYAMVIIETLLRDHADLLEEIDVHVVPIANPDGHHAGTSQAAGRRGVTRTVDADRDGLFDEDPPVDLDGDGRILWIRTTTPPRGVERTHVVDGDDPRRLRPPAADSTELPTHAVFTEGVDADGDGRIAEDGPGDVRLDHNFMHGYRPNLATAGPHQLSEPESLALANFVLDHPEIVGAVVFGPHDTVVTVPDHKALDRTGKVPTGITTEDLPTYRRFGEGYRELIGATLSHDEPDDGAFHAWLYAQRGVPVAAVTGWGPSTESPKTEDKAEADAGNRSPEDRWIQLLDESGPQHAIAEWRTFEHPTLGPVEIGGEIPGSRLNPPAGDLQSIGEKHARFVARVADERPRLVVDPVRVESLPGGLLRVDLKVTNTGQRPLRTEMARRNRAIRPLLIRPDVERSRILAGPPLTLVERLPSHGGHAETTWIIRDDGAPFDILIDDPQFGLQTTTVSPATAQGGAS